ncbi:hypothetical protein MPLB_1760113 [Mesorhizobium sp. ORS 3324]|nr:hypothetical protein MPLB_1760113 [Mesorhizobium sp. ORS 3324]
MHPVLSLVRLLTLDGPLGDRSNMIPRPKS